MVERIVWSIVVFGAAITFCLIGLYAKKREKPMCFWIDSPLDTATLTDIPNYNRENAHLWIGYSLWFWVAGLIGILSYIAALLILALACTVGFVFLIGTYKKILRKYSTC